VSNEFEVADIAYDRPPLEDQKGFFCSTEVPIRLLSITREAAAQDPFAL
jgi:hypothetical protein